MSDDLINIENQNSDKTESQEESATTSYGLGRWAHIPAMAVFGMVFLLLRDHPWRWYVALDCAYTVYVFGFAIGSVIKDVDDFFGDPDLRRCAAKQVIPHIPVLVVLSYGIHVWFHFNAVAPAWLTEEGRKGSLFEFLGWIALAGAGLAQGIWMAKRIKNQVRALENPV